MSGTAKALVVATGRKAQLGSIASALQKPPPPTAFAVGIQNFGMMIVKATVFLVLFVVLVNLLFHRPLLESFLFALALAVGLTPELLPMIVSVTLAHGAMRMARKQVIVKRQSAIDDLGSMDVFCSDKTGTLTEARIKLVREVDLGGQDSGAVMQMAQLNAAFETGLKSPLDEAILAAGKIDLAAWRKIDEVPFDFERRRVSILVEGGGRRLLIVKGAPEDILGHAARYEQQGSPPRPLDAAARKTAEATFNALGAEGYRVLGVAWREVEADREKANVADETDLTFAGFLAFLDPPKAGAREALTALANLGVALKVVTGDNEQVTRHVCGELGLKVTGTLTGPEVAASDRRGALSQGRRHDPVLPGHAAAEVPHHHGLAAQGPCRRLSRRRDQRRAVASCGGCRLFGGHRRRRRQGSGRHDPSAQGSRRARGRRARRPQDLRQHPQIYDDGNELEFRQHVLDGGRRSVPAVPADAADPNSSQQPALRPVGDDDPAGRGERRDGRRSRAAGTSTSSASSCSCSGR